MSFPIDILGIPVEDIRAVDFQVWKWVSRIYYITYTTTQAEVNAYRQMKRMSRELTSCFKIQAIFLQVDRRCANNSATDICGMYASNFWNIVGMALSR